MTKLTINNKDIIFPPDLTNGLNNEIAERKAGDLQVVETASDLISLVNARIDDLVERMNGIEAGEGQEWAVPLQTETTNRILGDQTNKNLIEDYNTAQTERVDGMVEELHDNTTRVQALEELQDDYVKQEGDAFLNSAIIGQGGLIAPTGNITGVFSVGQLIDHSDVPWTRISTTPNVNGQPGGVWMKKRGDTVSVMIRVMSPATATNNFKICDIPNWARLASPNNLMFTIPAWTTEGTGIAKLQIHANDTVGDPTNHDIIEILKPPVNTRYESMIKYELMYNMP